MNIWYLNHYSTPPSCGAYGRPYYLARSLQKHGANVIVFCASIHHGRITAAPIDQLRRPVVNEWVTYYHLPTRSYKGNGLMRILNMLDYAREIKKLKFPVDSGLLQKPDILIPSCVHPFSYVSARALARRYKAKLIYEVRDIWPLSLVEMLDTPRWHPLVLWLDYIERSAYRYADAVVSLLPNALEHMQSRGLTEDRFTYISNGISIEEFEEPHPPLPAEHQMVFDKVRRSGKLIVVYTGSHGPGDALDQIFTLKQLYPQSDPPYHFILIGDGTSKDELVHQAVKQNVTFVTFLPRITKKQVATALKQADVFFIGWLDRPIYRYGVSPNKLGEYFYAGKPIIQTLITKNDPVSIAKAGFSIEPYKPEQLNDCLCKIISMPIELREEMGKNGRAYAIEHLDWNKLGERYFDLCMKVFGGSNSEAFH